MLKLNCFKSRLKEIELRFSFLFMLEFLDSIIQVEKWEINQDIKVELNSCVS